MNATEAALKKYPARMMQHAFTLQQYDYNEHDRTVWIDGYNAGVESKWLAYPENKPEHDTSVLITDGEQVDEAWFGKRTSNDVNGFRFTKIHTDTVTHWQSLPSPPQTF